MSREKSDFATNKKYLNRYNNLNKKISDLEARFYDYFENENRTEIEQQYINDAYVRLDNYLKQIDTLRIEIYECIDQLDCSIEIRVLELFFIAGKTLGEIADDLNYSERHINRIYKRAVLNVSIDKTHVH